MRNKYGKLIFRLTYIYMLAGICKQACIHTYTKKDRLPFTIFIHTALVDQRPQEKMFAKDAI